MQNILLAAGLASRSGGEKLFYPYQGHTIIHHSVAASLAAGLFTVVVTGHRAEEVASELLDLSSPSLLTVNNPHYARGQGSSTQAGVAALDGGLPFFISLADMPLIEAGHYRTLCDAYTGAPLRPRCGAKVGHPVLLPPSFIPLIAAQEGPFAMKELLASSPMEYLDTNEEAYVRDVDTASSYHALVKGSSPRP